MKQNGYTSFAGFYDRLTSDVDYAGAAAYLLGLFRLHGGRTDTLLDLACGSGSLSLELARQGADLIGVDGSEDMLALAQEKAAAAGLPLLFLHQDMRALDLYGTVSGAVCTLDSLNHILRTQELEEILRRLHLFVDPEGLLIFDANTPYKHREVLADNDFVYEEPDFTCVWRNRFLPRTGETDMLLDFFVEEADGRYLRLTDRVRERAYSKKTWERLLSGSGFHLLAVYSEGTAQAPSPDCQRWVFVARNTPH